MKISVVVAVLLAIAASAQASEVSASCEGCQTLVAMNQLLIADADMDQDHESEAAHNACAMLADVHTDHARNCVDLLYSGSLDEASDLLVQHGTALCASSCSAPAVHYLDDDADTEGSENDIAQQNDAEDSKLETGAEDDSELDADDGKDPLASEDDEEEKDALTDSEEAGEQSALAVNGEDDDDDESNPLEESDDDDDDDDDDSEEEDDDEDDIDPSTVQTALAEVSDMMVSKKAKKTGGEANGWTKVRSASRQVTCHAASNVWTVGDDDRAYNYAGNRQWRASPAVKSGVAMVATSCQTQTYALSKAGAVFRFISNKWVRLEGKGVPTGGFGHIVVGNDDEVIALGKKDHRPYQYRAREGSWRMLYPIGLKSLAVSCDHHVVGIALDGRGIVLKGSVETTAGKYYFPPGARGFNSISAFDQENIYATTPTGGVYRLVGGRVWKILPKMRLTEIEVGADRVACGVFNGKVYLRGARAGVQGTADRFNPEGVDKHSSLVSDPFAAAVPQKVKSPLAHFKPGKNDLNMKDPLPYSDKYKFTKPSLNNWDQFSPQQNKNEPKYNPVADPLPAAESTTVQYQKHGKAEPPAASHAHTWNNGEMHAANSDHQITYPQPTAESPANTFKRSVKEANYNLHDPAYKGKDTQTLAGLRP